MIMDSVHSMASIPYEMIEKTWDFLLAHLGPLLDSYSWGMSLFASAFTRLFINEVIMINKQGYCDNNRFALLHEGILLLDCS